MKPYGEGGVMDAGVRRSIEELRKGILERWSLPASERGKLDELFGEIEELGSRCGDRREFEEMFHRWTLANELYRMMLDFGNHVVAKTNATQRIK